MIQKRNINIKQKYRIIDISEYLGISSKTVIEYYISKKDFFESLNAV